MKDIIIQNYINKLTIEDIIKFAQNNNIHLSTEESKHILYHAKKDWKTILYSNPTPIFEALQKEISTENYEKGKRLYEEYKQKYQSFL